MASVDLVARTEDDPSPRPHPTVRLGWDPSVGPTPVGFGWDAEPLVLDWDGEGRADLLVTAGGGPRGRRAWAFRPVTTAGAEPTRYDAGEPVEALDGLRALCAIPNGRDSRFDLVGLDETGLVLLANEGSGRRPAFGPRRSLGIGPDLGIGPCRVVQMVAVDWDGDGLTDLLVGVDDLAGYWPDCPRLPTTQQKGFNQQGGHPGYDRNGLWRGATPRGRLFWLRDVGRPGAPEFLLQPEIVGDTHPLDVGLHPAPLAVSWQRPGSLELMLTDRRGLIHLHRNFGDQRPPVLMEPRTLLRDGAQFVLPDERTALVAADLDGDRRDELVFGTSDGRVFAVHAGAGGRHEVKNPHVLLHDSADLWVGGHAVLTSGDLDGDGGLDLVSGDATGRLHVYRDAGGPGQHLYRGPSTLEAGGAPFRLDPGPDGMADGPAFARLGFACPLLADWTGNGRPDLLVGGPGGDVLFLRNDGASNDPRFASPVPLRCEGLPLITPPRVRPAAVDWGGTGQLDLVALDLQGFLCVYPRTGTTELGRPVPLVDRLGRFLRLDGGFGLSGRCSLSAGSWCGSGRNDLLVGLPRGNRHVVPALTGLPLTDADALPTVLLLENIGHGVLCPRPIFHADGRPLAPGHEGCSPSGVDDGNGGGLDLLIGHDDGRVTLLRRDELRW
jgi:hypothetical protein